MSSADAYHSCVSQPLMYVTGVGMGILNTDPATHQDFRFVGLTF